jgi:hypothetical protein
MTVDPRFLTSPELDKAIVFARHDLQYSGACGELAKQFLEVAEPLREARDMPRGRKVEVEKTSMIRISGSKSEIEDVHKALKALSKRTGLPATRALVQLILLAGREAEQMPVDPSEEVTV